MLANECNTSMVIGFFRWEIYTVDRSIPRRVKRNEKSENDSMEKPKIECKVLIAER